MESKTVFEAVTCNGTGYTPEANCNHYGECPNYCSCPANCGCWIGNCRNSYPILRKIMNDPFKCPRCESLIDSMQVHDQTECARQNEERKSFAAAFRRIGTIEEKQMSDEDLAKLYFAALNEFQPLPELNETQFLDDLTLREVRHIANFVRALRK